MQKLTLTLACCLLAGHCFSQNNKDKSDSIQLKPAIPQQIKDSLQHDSRQELTIYPNPAKNKITLQVKGFEPGIVLVKILDTKGKMIREDSRLLTNGSEDIIMFLMLQPGIYFIIVSEKGKVSRKKLVII